MTQIERQEYNKRCAEFLGGEYRRKESLTYEPKGRWYIDQFPDAEQDYNLKFHSDWNWIMEVVQEIEKLGFTFIINDCNCYFYKDSINNAKAGFGNTKKEAVVQAIDKFLIWYKTNDTTNKNRISQ